MYHADISLTKRNAVHENFVKDKLQIVVATVAFGMGIDKPGNYLFIYFLYFKYSKTSIKNNFPSTIGYYIYFLKNFSYFVFLDLFISSIVYQYFEPITGSIFRSAFQNFSVYPRDT